MTASLTIIKVVQFKLLFAVPRYMYSCLHKTKNGETVACLNLSKPNWQRTALKKNSTYNAKR